MAQNTSAAEVCKEYGIQKSTFCGWKNQIDLNLDYQKGQYSKHPGRKPLGQHLDNFIDNFIESKEEGQKEFSVESIVLAIMKFDPTFKDNNFKQVRAWLYHYLERNDISIRNKTHVAQKSCDLETCCDFVDYVNEVNETFLISPDYIINMDETPVYFDNAPSTKVKNYQ